MRLRVAVALGVCTVATAAFAAPKKGEWVQNDAVGVNLVTCAFDTGKATGVGDVAALSEFVGVHDFGLDRLRTA